MDVGDRVYVMEGRTDTGEQLEAGEVGTVVGHVEDREIIAFGEGRYAEIHSSRVRELRPIARKP